jgi:TonB family protein
LVLLAAVTSSPRHVPLRIEMELAEAPVRPPPVEMPPPPIARVIAKEVVKKLVRAKKSEPAPKEAPAPPPKVGVSEAELSPEGEMAVASGVTLDGVLGTGTGTVAKTEGVQGGTGTGRVKHVPIFAVTRLPKAKSVVEPDVPESYRSRSRDIVVVLELDIDAQGRVEGVRVIRGAGSDLDRAVMRAAEETEFEPALVGADPVPVRYRIPYRIRVRG